MLLRFERAKVELAKGTGILKTARIIGSARWHRSEAEEGCSPKPLG
jgi:hypothetical protein